LFSVFILASNALVDKQDLRRTLGVVAVCGFLVSVYGLAQHFGFDFFPWQQLEEVPTSRGASTLGHPTFAASFLLLSIPLTLVSAVIARTLYGRLLAAAAAATMASHFLITGARGATLAACVAIVTVLMVARLRLNRAATHGERKYSPWRTAWRFSAVAVVLVALMAGLMVTTWRVKRSDALALRQGSGAIRLFTYQSAARLWTHHPFTGVGAGNYEIMSPTAWNRQEQERFSEMNRMSYEVHNEYVEALAEQGVIGLGVLLALLYAAMLEAYRISLGAVDRDGRRVGLALLAAVIAAAADAFLIFNMQIPGPALYFWMVLGLVVYSGRTLVPDRDQAAPYGARSVGDT
jgi:O-antigen ligase